MRTRIGEANLRRQLMAVSALAAVAPAAGVLASFVSDCGRHVDQAFFVVCGSVGPLVGLALFIDISVVINDVAGTQGLTAANRGLAFVLVYGNAVLMVGSEALALYALAAHQRTTFLVVGAVVPLLLQTLLLAEAALFKVRAITLSPG